EVADQLGAHRHAHQHLLARQVVDLDAQLLVEGNAGEELADGRVQLVVGGWMHRRRSGRRSAQARRKAAPLASGLAQRAGSLSAMTCGQPSARISTSSTSLLMPVAASLMDLASM